MPEGRAERGRSARDTAKSIDGAEHSVTIEGVMAGVRTRGLESIQMMRQHVDHYR